MSSNTSGRLQGVHWWLVTLSLGLLLIATALAALHLPKPAETDEDALAYGTPQGTVYPTPTNSVTGGWTVATVRDIYGDRYSFTAFVPLSSSKASDPRTFRTLQGTETADGLVRSQTGFEAYDKRNDGLTTFVLHRPTVKAGAPQPDVPKLDLSVVPGTVLFVNFRCVLPNNATNRATPPKSDEAGAEKAVVPSTAQTDTCLTAPPKQGGPKTAATTRYYVQELGIVSAQPGVANRMLVAVLVAASFIALVYGLFWDKKPGGLAHLILGKDGRYSNSQFQTVTWFFIFFVAFLTTQIFRVTHGNLSLAAWISVPGNLLAVSGLSLLTFVGAAIITDTQIKNQQIVKVTAQNPSFPGDLFHNDAGEFDLGDFQSALVSVIAAGGYLLIFLGYLGSLSLKRDMLPDVDGTLLAIFGLAQGAYLAKKALRVSEQEAIALSVTPATIICTAGNATCTVTLSVAWNLKLSGKKLSLSAVRDDAAYTATFSPVVLPLTDSLGADVQVALTNPGAGAVEDVVLRGVVNGIVREARVTVTGA